MDGRLDTLAKPPLAIKSIYKRFQKFDLKAIDDCCDITDFVRDDCMEKRWTLIANPESSVPNLQKLWSDFDISGDQASLSVHVDQPEDMVICESIAIPGLFVYPSLIPSSIQLDLLDKLLHRDLSNPTHQTNLHLHYNVPSSNTLDLVYRTSYFDDAGSNLEFEPKDTGVHKPLTTQQVLDKKLRWMTLGGQYDWTNKIYPKSQPPPFPPDIKQLIEAIFPMKAEAAILNIYSPGDTLSLHRDVSEECDQPLVSISLGCDGIFVVGIDELDENGNARVEVIRLRCGDALLMSGRSRYAWHAVPKILEGTCPAWMQNWPFREVANPEGLKTPQYARWKGWMKGKRVNLNVRQMFDQDVRVS